MIDSLTRHWPEYVMEAAGLGFFMLAACLFGTMLEYPASPIHQAISNPVSRRVLMGLAMGLTAVTIIYSPWGKQSGAHINPSVTLTFYRLKKVKAWDAFFYMTAQFFGGVAGVLIAAALLGNFLSNPSVNYVATVPGRYGVGAAFLAELVISFLLMSVVLTVSSNPKIHRFTGLFAGALVATYIALEAPISGMSMNPARSFASALPARQWMAFWIYLTAPVLGMLLAADAHRRFKGAEAVLCAKLHHQNDKRCIFCGAPGITQSVTHS
jgi:aquaporin Z